MRIAVVFGRMKDDIEVRVSEGRPAEASFKPILTYAIVLSDEP